jgi:hypothetical protein
MIIKKAQTVIALFSLLICVGCASDPIRFNEAPTKTIDFSKGRHISGEFCGFQLLWLIPIKTNGREARAYTELLAQARGDYITDIQIEERWFYGFVGTGYCTKLTATAYPLKNQ